MTIQDDSFLCDALECEVQDYLFLCKLLQDQTLLQECGHLVTWEGHWDLETGA